MEKKVGSARGHMVGNLFVFLLICVFALLSLCTVLLSVRSWTGITTDVSALQEQRVAQGYLRTRLRGADRVGALTAETAEGQTILTIEEDGYLTRIYCYDGALMEQLIDPEDTEPFDPALGESLCALAGLEAEETEKGLVLRLTFDDGITRDMTTTRRTGGDAA